MNLLILHDYMKQMNDVILIISKYVVCSIFRTVWHIHDRPWRGERSKYTIDIKPTKHCGFVQSGYELGFIQEIMPFWNKEVWYTIAFAELLNAAVKKKYFLNFLKSYHSVHNFLKTHGLLDDCIGCYYVFVI